MHVRSLLAAVVAVCLVAGPASAGEVLAKKARRTLRALERDALTLAQTNRPEDAKELLDALDRLGHDAKFMERARERCAKALREAGERGPAPMTGDRLRRAAKDLAKHLPNLPEEERTTVAEIVLQLDETVGAAHEALGHEKHGERWVAREHVGLLEREAAIAEQVKLAEAMEVPLVEEPTDVGFLNTLQGDGGTQVRWENVSLHSKRVGVKTRRKILEPLLRALAMSEWLRTGEMKIPRPRAAFKVIFCADHGEYMKAIDLSLEAKGLGRANAAVARFTSRYADKRGFHVVGPEPLPWRQSSLLLELWHHVLHKRHHAMPQPCLALGHVNWLSLKFFGRHVPHFVWHKNRDGATSEDPAKRARLAKLVKDAQQGYDGTRAYLAHLAAMRQDPPWARSVQKKIGKIQGDDLLKTTVVVAFLQETGQFPALLADTVREPRTTAAIQTALGMSLADFEIRWRSWLTTEATGLAGRVGWP